MNRDSLKDLECPTPSYATLKNERTDINDIKLDNLNKTKLKNKEKNSKVIIEEEEYDDDDVNNNRNQQKILSQSQIFNRSQVMQDDSIVGLSQLEETTIKLSDIAQQEESQDDKNRQNKKQLIKQKSYQRRSTMIFLTILVILLLSIYFVIAYFLAMKTFETAKDVVQSLELIFYKGSCFDSTMNFLRESEIRGKHLKLDDKGGVSATDYYLDFCLQKEKEYKNMRMNIPAYFEQARSLIESLDSKEMCDIIYQGQFAYLHDFCKTSLNGILSQGLSNSFYYMYAQILKDNLQVSQAIQNHNLTTNKRLLLDNEIIQIIDMKARLLDPSLTALKEKCITSVVQYIQKLLQNFVVAFIVFILILTLGVIIILIVSFNKLRQSMWDTNIILKIIPFEAIDKKQRIKIKDFFNS